MNISWKDKITNIEAGLPSMEEMLIQMNLRWLRHVERMDHQRLPRQLLYSQLRQGKCNLGRPRLRFKDTAKKKPGEVGHRQEFLAAEGKGQSCVEESDQTYMKQPLNFDGLRMKQSSTWRELKSVSFALRCFAPNSHNSSVKLYTDNKGVAFITDSGSNKPHLNVIAKDIFCFTSAHDIDMLNQKADYYSKIIDFDNWCVSNAYFREIDSSDEVP
ncbi:hypothetical protein P5673_029566 [Acropora cervicornis]|uniref:Uncharacterized protein n=1 Tax=Acropora cervicornis TaxID=6130 RepID=A0AAD9PVF0_ACRCE|nr:hypothetical protein P5673_029566 [Acropora cervicornis]